MTTKVAVTGATGFLGRRLVKLLCEKGHQVTCLVRPSSNTDALREFIGQESFESLQIKAVTLSNRDECAIALAGSDVLYHLAAGMTGSTATGQTGWGGAGCKNRSLRSDWFAGSLWCC